MGLAYQFLERARAHAFGQRLADVALAGVLGEEVHLHVDTRSAHSYKQIAQFVALWRQAHRLVTEHPATAPVGTTGRHGVSRRYPNGLRGTGPATPWGMLVDIVFEYRTLVGRAELGCGLNWDEIDRVSEIEHAFRPTADDRRMKNGRRFRRDAIRLEALVRGDRINDRVEITSGIDANARVVISGGAFLSEGALVRVVAPDSTQSAQ